MWIIIMYRPIPLKGHTSHKNIRLERSYYPSIIAYMTDTVKRRFHHLIAYKSSTQITLTSLIILQDTETEN